MKIYVIAYYYICDKNIILSYSIRGLEVFFILNFLLYQHVQYISSVT